MFARWAGYLSDLGSIYFLEKLRIKRKMIPHSNIRRLNYESNYEWAKCIYQAVEVLKHGGIIAVPTDTLYGICTLAENAEKLYRLKGRPEHKPLGLFIDRPENITTLAKQTVPTGLLKNLFPGPVTVVFYRSENLPSKFNPGTPSVAFRIPQSKFIRDLCSTLPYELIAQTSANISGSDKNPLCIEDFQELWDEIDLIIDIGPITENNGSRLGSTVIDLTIPGQFKLLRAGCAEIEMTRILREYDLKSHDEVERERLGSGDVTPQQIESDMNEVLDIRNEEKQERRLTMGDSNR